jgi:hypothetical protein
MILLLLTSGIGHYGHRIGSLKLNFNLETVYYGFQALFLNMSLNSKDDGLGHIESNIVYPILLFYLSPLINLILTQPLLTLTS